MSAPHIHVYIDASYSGHCAPYACSKHCKVHTYIRIEGLYTYTAYSNIMYGQGFEYFVRPYMYCMTVSLIGCCFYFPGVGELIPCNFSPSDLGGCYRDVKTTPVGETDPVIKALELDNGEKDCSPFVSQLSQSGFFNEDSLISIQSPDCGYVSETTNHQSDVGFFSDSVYSPGFPMSFSVPPSRSVSSATPEPSTPYPTHPSPVSANNQSGDNGQFDYNWMSDYPSTRLHSPFHSWGNSQITQHVPQTPSMAYVPPSPKPPTSDQKYLERRKKNNEASRISRKRRKQKVEELDDRAKELLLENEDLKGTVAQLESEIGRVREQLLQFLSNKGRIGC